MKLSYAEGVVLVTGGSGAIGSEIVSALAGSGLPVAFTYNRGKDAAEQLLQKLASTAAVSAHAWNGSSAEEAVALAKTIEDQRGPIRFMVASSGISQSSSFPRMGEEEWLKLIDTNLTAVIALARAVVRPMLLAGTGRIVFIGSVAGVRGLNGLTVYSATKAGLDGFTRALAREAAPFGVTVNCIAPGFIDTPMLAGIPEQALKALVGRIPLKRLGSTADVAALVAFLLSSEAAYVTGQSWVIDGGLSI